MTSSQLGRGAAFGMVLVGAGYAVALAIGFAVYGSRQPIVDPLLGVMEVLTLVSAPLLLVLMVAVHARTPPARRIFSVIALAFMTLLLGATSTVHFVGLTAGRQLGSGGLVWPSRAYALELLAWDVFLGLSLVFAALTFTDDPRERRIRRWLLTCGGLCLAGVLGPAVGDMRLQFVGVLGYAGVLPIVSLLLANQFRDDARGEASPN